MCEILFRENISNNLMILEPDEHLKEFPNSAVLAFVAHFLLLPFKRLVTFLGSNNPSTETFFPVNAEDQSSRKK